MRALLQDRPTPRLGVIEPTRPLHRLKAVDSGVRAASDAELVHLQSAFESTGGVVTGDEIARLMRDHAEQPISLLARWIVKREVVSFTWRSQTLLPLFQFDLETACIRPGARELIAELCVAFDELDLVTWFARPNAWLAGSAPVDILARDLQAVRDAARADRFVALG